MATIYYFGLFLILALLVHDATCKGASRSKSRSSAGKAGSGGSSSSGKSGDTSRGGYIYDPASTYKSSGYMVKQRDGSLYDGSYNYRYFPLGLYIASGSSNVGLRYQDADYYEDCQTAYMPFQPPAPLPPLIATATLDSGSATLDDTPPAPSFSNQTVENILNSRPAQTWPNFDAVNQSLYNQTGYYLTDCILTYNGVASPVCPLTSFMMGLALLSAALLSL